MSNRSFFWRHVRAPLLFFALMAGVLATTPLDRQIAHILFFNEAHSRWLGAGTWWANALIHQGGAWLVRILVVGALALWITTYIKPWWAPWRRPALYFAVSTLLGVGLVGLLKVLTHVDCPWDLTEFGGRFPFIDLFEHRPEAWRRAQCFPSGHASAGYALLALYFTFRERSLRTGQLGLLAGPRDGPDLWARSTVTRRAFPLARCLERNAGLDRRACAVHFRIQGPPVGSITMGEQ